MDRICGPVIVSSRSTATILPQNCYDSILHITSAYSITIYPDYLQITLGANIYTIKGIGIDEQQQIIALLS